MDFLKKGFKSLRLKKDKVSVFGDLEEKLMNVIWERGNGTVSEVRSYLNNKYAHTTIMTVLDRLYKKGILRREREGKGYRYYPILSKEEFEKLIAKKVLNGLTKTNPSLALTAFEGLVENLSDEEIERLKKLIEEKEREKNDK